MDPSAVCCPNADCPDKGQQGQGNIGIHSQKERRYCCTTCDKTFAATRGTAFDRVHHPVELLVLVVTLLCHGCPAQAIVAAFGLDERTVAAWVHRTGRHAARVHTAVVETRQVELGQVQADEICVKGTVSHGTRVYDLRHARYTGLAKTHLQHVFTAAAINVIRLVAWAQETPLAATRISPFARLQQAA